MPGPGGGSHGGGFGGGSRGGFGGGSRGGFRGSPHGGPRGGFWHRPPVHHGPRPFFRRRYYGGGGGCLGGFLGMLLVPVIILLFVGMMLLSFIGSAVDSVSRGGDIRYNEATFQEYANKQYSAEFSSSTAYEDNMMIVFLTNEEADGYYAIAWVGDNINREITDMFGNEYTALGRAMENSINTEYYAYSLSSNLATVMETMTEKVVSLGLDSSFKSQQDHSKMTESHLTNHSDLALNQSTVDTALKDFTEKTDIPAVIVVDTMENVFGKTLPAADIIIVVIMVALVVFAIYLIVRAFRNRKNTDGNTGNVNM